MSVVAEPASIAQTTAVEKDQELVINRLLSAPRELVWKVYTQPEHVIHWWGPNGFSNTFERFEFKPGGQWVFVMHGPDGTGYPNESVFSEILPNAEIVIEHVVKPRYRLTVTLSARGDKTHLAWTQVFESPELAAKMRAICEPANEQNLDWLEALLASETA